MLWFLAATTTVIADNGATGTAGTLIHALLVLPTSAAAVGVLAFWAHSHWTIRGRR